MKKIKYLFIILTSMMIASCTDFLDIRPENEIVLDEYWQSESQATSVLSAAYRAMITDESVKRLFIWGEVRSDNVKNGGSFDGDISKIIKTEITPTNSYADWASIYKTINLCNTFIHFAPNVVGRDPNFSITKLNTLLAEARGLRALNYFYLIRAFKDVPLTTEASVADDQNYFIGQSPERQVLDTIIQDLIFAQTYAKETYAKGSYNKGRISKKSATAILADVYLWDQQYENCVQQCDMLLKDTSYTLLLADKVIPEVFYKGNSKESILELQFDVNVQNSGALNTLIGYAGYDGNLSFPFELTVKGDYSPFNFRATVREGEFDIRQYTSYGTTGSGEGSIIYKYSTSNMIQIAESEGANISFAAVFRESTHPVNFVMYRLSDVILMKAEALVQLNRTESDLKEAIKLVNKTYLRSNTTVDSLDFMNYNDKTRMEKLVLRERQREFLFEGKRWFDLLRMARREGNTVNLLQYLNFKLQGSTLSRDKLSIMDGLYMPVLKHQIEINPQLKQNEFYIDETTEN